MRDVQAVNAIHYPDSRLASVGWMRAALLYWEGLLRIVPDGCEPLDSPEVDRLVRAGLIENVSPTRYFRSATEVFERRLEELLRTPRERRFGSNRPMGTLIRVAELEPGLLQALQTRGLARTAGEWASMSPELATLYRVTLANEIGQALHTAIATDEPGFDVAGTFLSGLGLTRDRQSEAPVDGFACVRTLNPFPNIERGGLTDATLLELRRNHASQRRAFRERVQARAVAITTLPSAAIESQLKDFQTELQSEVDARRNALRSSNLYNVWRTARVGSPAALGAAVTLAGAPSLVAVAGIIGSAGIAVTDWLLQQRRLRRTNDHYLLSLDAAVSTRTPRGERSSCRRGDLRST
jgi:hypothetical protein